MKESPSHSARLYGRSWPIRDMTASARSEHLHWSSGGLLDERDEVVFADSLRHQERGGIVAPISDKVRAARLDRVRVTGTKPYLFFGLAKEKPESSVDHVKRVLHIAVKVPGNLQVCGGSTINPPYICP